jgi:hypothetical protein
MYDSLLLLDHISVVNKGAPAAPLNKTCETYTGYQNATYRKLNPEGKKGLAPCLDDGRTDLRAVRHICISVVRAKQGEKVSKLSTFDDIEALMGNLSSLIMKPNNASPGHSPQ